MINRIKQYELRAEGVSIMTTLGIIGGEILTDLEQHGPSTVRRLIRELSWSAPLVTMAIGSLIRGGLVRATQQELEIVVEPQREFTPVQAEEVVPEVWVVK